MRVGISLPPLLMLIQILSGIMSGIVTVNTASENIAEAVSSLHWSLPLEEHSEVLSPHEDRGRTDNAVGGF